MNKKALAIAITAIMILGLFSALVPVANAQKEGGFCSPYHSAPICVFLHPGVEDAWKHGWSHTLDTLWNATTGDPGQKQQVFDKYLDYAIMASGSDSVGDLQFDIDVFYAVYGIKIYVPPEFTFLAPTVYESVWTDITNDFEFYRVSTASAYDPVAPGWKVITIGDDRGPNSRLMIPVNDHAQPYHIRLFNLRAPDAAGLYHFKIFTASIAGVYTSIHPGNFPFVIVKTELNPAWVEATIQTAFNDAPAYVSGHVVAEGTTPEGRAVTGVAYWGPMEFVGNGLQAGFTGAMYKTYLFGLAAGTYTFTAEGSGFNPSITERVTLDPGQSYHLFISIYKSPKVCVTIWSKHGTGEIPWANLWQKPYGTNNPDAPPNDSWPWRDILIDLYDSQGALVGFWASNVFGLNHITPSLRHSPSTWWGIASKVMPLNNELLGLHDEEAPHPEKTSYYACLVDNVGYNTYLNVGDPQTVTTRGYPSTHWDGHVPWDMADYIAGFPKGDYTLESFVTGYIMDEADAWQRTFTITGSPVTLQFDLRRSNWIEVTAHMPSDTVLSKTSTFGLTAEDPAGNERASSWWFVTSDMSDTDNVINGHDASIEDGAGNAGLWSHYDGGIVLEGWNAVFPGLYSTPSYDPMRKDYGLNPTEATHTAGTVTLAGNPYTIKMYLTDMGYPSQPSVNSEGFPIWNATGWYSIVGADPQVSVFLCNSPTPLSFAISNAKIWISLRSVDFEVPAHSRPWLFPGSEIYVDFIDAEGNYVDTLDASTYGLYQDPGMWLDGQAVHAASGQAAGVEWKANHNPYTGWQIKGVRYDDTFAAHDWTTGLPVPYDLAYPFGVTPYDIDYTNDAGLHEHLGVYYFGTDPGMNILYPILGVYRPTRLPPGEYTYEAWTHGYVMRRAFPFQIPLFGMADIEADLIEGGQIRVCMDFTHEGQPIEFNGFVRVEVFNAEENLVGASIYGQAEPNIYKRQTLPAGYGTYLSYDAWGTHWDTGDAGPSQAAGLGYYASNYTYPSLSEKQRAYNMMHQYAVPTSTWSGWSAAAHGFSARDTMLDMEEGDAVCFDVYGFYWYHGDKARTWAGGWPTVTNWGTQWDWGYSWADQGLKGSRDIPGWEGSGGGLYTVKVWAFDPMGPNDEFEHFGDVYTDDWNMYSMGWELTNIEVPWDGAVSLWVTMNNMAKLRGTVRWLDMFGNLRALPWAQISASPGPATDSIPAFSTGVGASGPGSSDPSGSYLMWLPAGAHDVSVSTSEAPGVWSSAAPTSNAEYTVVVSDGWVAGGDTQLAESGVPVPELPSYAAPLAMFALIAASVWLLRKNNLNAPLLMK